MENKTKIIKKQCPICGTFVDENVDYCPICDSYVGDVPLYDDSIVESNNLINEKSISEQRRENSTNEDFENLDTILSETEEHQSKITIEDLQNLLSAQGNNIIPTIANESYDKAELKSTVASELKTQTNENNLPKRNSKNIDSDTYYDKTRPPKRKDSKKRKHQIFLTGHKSEEDVLSIKQEDPKDQDPVFDESDSHENFNFNQPEKIIIPTQTNMESDSFSFEESSADSDKYENYQNKTNHNFLKKVLDFILESLVYPSSIVDSSQFWHGLLVFASEFVLFVFSFQLLYNSGVQMLQNKVNHDFGQYLVSALTIGKKYSVLWLIITIFALYLSTIGLGIIFDWLLIRESNFSVETFIAQVARYSAILLPISILTFVYSLFNSPILTKLILFLGCLVPVVLILAVLLFLIQAKGLILFDRVYISLLYVAISFLISYIILRPFFISFIQAFNRFLG